MIINEEIVVAGLPLHFPKPAAGNQLPSLAEWNQRYIEYVLSFTKGKKTAAARILGINRRTLYRRKKPKSSSVGIAAQGVDSMLDDRVPAGQQVQ
jgi:transcriptional regulator of acetoin/glycerol metabolism